MQNYEVVQVEDRELANGKPWKRATLKGADGTIHEGVAIWSNFPQFHTIVRGAEVFGIAENKGKGWSLSPTGGAPAPRRSGGASSAEIGLNIERKNQGIKEAMGHKDLGIKLAGVMRDATLLVTTFYPEYAALPSPQKENVILGMIEKWRGVLLQAWDEGRELTGSETFI